MQTKPEEDNLPKLNNRDFPVSRIQAVRLTPKIFFEEYQNHGIPVVITGLLDAEADWTLDYLCEKLGTTEFPIRYNGRQRYEQDKRKWANIGSGVETKTMFFLQYAELLRNGEAKENALYLAKATLTNTPLADATLIKSAEASMGLQLPATDINLWLGLGGHTTCLHYDTMDGTLMQLHGAKRIVLFPPSQLYNLYPFPVAVHLRHGLRKRAGYSQVYPEKPDFQSFPKFKLALQHRHEVILNRGDILFIPAGWSHEVTALGNEIVCSVNRFWHVYPFSRAVRSWSKWRVHLGSVCAMPHALTSWLTAMSSSKHSQGLSEVLKRL